MFLFRRLVITITSIQPKIWISVVNTITLQVPKAPSTEILQPLTAKGFGSHFINVALGANIRQFEYDLKGMAATGFSNDRLINIGFCQRLQMKIPRPGVVQAWNGFFGSFLNVNYSFKNKYLVDVSFRADGSSKFGSDNKVAPFYSMGLGWNLHRRKFYEGYKMG